MVVKVNNKFRKARNAIEQKAQQFVLAATTIGASSSIFYAPLEYGTLRNSQRIDLSQAGSQTIGTVSFNVGYAAVLETKKDWKPRPPSQKKGPAWNPNAVPGFLSWGFENPESRSAINRAKKVFKV